jgi:hypothetical protein
VSTPAAVHPPGPAARSGCGCEIPAGSMGSGGFGAALAALLGLALRRRAARRR